MEMLSFFFFFQKLRISLLYQFPKTFGVYSTPIAIPSLRRKLVMPMTATLVDSGIDRDFIYS